MPLSKPIIVRLIALTLAALPFVSPVTAQDRVDFPGRDGERLQAVEMKPKGPGPFPAIVALHGCGGLGKRLNSRHRDWAEKLVEAGFIVVFPDSFGSRGLGSQCRVRDRDIRSKERAEDAFAAAEWLAARPDVVRAKIGLLGWSNGGTSVLSASRSIRAPKGGVEFRQAVALYPGCRAFANGNYRARIPVTILHGLADDWTSPEPCKNLAGTSFIGYEGAHHDFDYPDMAIRKRKAAFSADGSGMVTVGTHPEARKAAMAKAFAIFRGM
jgi:dienelactone hydrolase